MKIIIIILQKQGLGFYMYILSPYSLRLVIRKSQNIAISIEIILQSQDAQQICILQSAQVLYKTREKKYEKKITPTAGKTQSRNLTMHVSYYGYLMCNHSSHLSQITWAPCNTITCYICLSLWRISFTNKVLNRFSPSTLMPPL